MNPLTHDWNRLELLLSRLHDLELRLPEPNERAIVEVARVALTEEVHALAHRIGHGDYWRRHTAARLRTG